MKTAEEIRKYKQSTDIVQRDFEFISQEISNLIFTAAYEGKDSITINFPMKKFPHYKIEGFMVKRITKLYRAFGFYYYINKDTLFIGWDNSRKEKRVIELENAIEMLSDSVCGEHECIFCRNIEIAIESMKNEIALRNNN